VNTRREIVYLTSTFEPELGGTVRQSANQARALRNRGYEVTILTRRTRPDLPTKEQRGGLQIRRFGGRPGRLGEFLAMLGWAGWLLRRRRRVAAVQVVMHPEFLLSAVAAGLLTRASMLWVGRGDADMTLSGAGGRVFRLLRFARRVVVKRAHNIVLTPQMATEVARYSAAEAAVIPVPVDSEHFRPPTRSERERARYRLGLSEADTLLLYTGHLEPHKGLHNLLDALSVTSLDTYKLCVVGGARKPRTGYEARLRSDVERLGLEDRVVFFGYVEDVRDPFLWASDLFILPSEREGMPNAVLEAMACGLPCILPGSAGGDELIDRGFGAVPPDNTPGELAKVLRTMLSARAEWEQMGKGARRAAQRYSMEAVTNTYELVYRQLGCENLVQAKVAGAA
jgi:glycosyltransferase involved in cell wall biosynthesis